MKGLRKIFVAIIGFPIVLVGIILIPLPGPGLLVSALGLFILSLEFDWAQKYFDETKRGLENIYKKARERADKIEQKSHSKDDK